MDGQNTYTVKQLAQLIRDRNKKNSDGQAPTVNVDFPCKITVSDGGIKLTEGADIGFGGYKRGNE